METRPRGSHLFLGVTLFTQAVTSLAAGIVFLNPFNTQTIDEAFMRMVAGSNAAAYVSIALQAVTAVVIVLLGAALYRASGRSRTAAAAAFGLYAAEAVLLLAGQAFVFGMMQSARLYAESGDPQLIALTKILYACREFSGGIAMVPFGVGALIFYSRITLEGVVPRWLGWYGIITVIPIIVGVPLGVFGADVPFLFLAPYVPFEFAAGAYLIVKSLRRRTAAV